MCWSMRSTRAAASTRAGLSSSSVAPSRCILTLQNLGEFYNVCARKRQAPPDAAARRAMEYAQLFPVVEPRMDDARAALGEAAAGRFSYWDAFLLATLDRAGRFAML